MAGRKGNTEPRVFTPPLSGLTPETSLGFEVIEFAENILGITLRPWQKWLFIHALELDPESDYQDYRFRQVVVLVGRQNGKTLIMIVLGLWRLFVDGAAEILSTAQNLAVAEKTLKDAFKIAKNTPAMVKYLPHRVERGKWVPFMRTANGSNQIELSSVPVGLEDVLDVSGAMPAWFVVATNGGGRSFSADVALLDEVREHHNEDVWDAVAPTTAERPRNQIWAFSNAGDRRSVVLRRLRNVGLAALNSGDTSEERLGLFEWSAEPGRSIFDPDGWAEANPSLGYGNRTERDMKALAKQALDPEAKDASENGFKTEYLCQWVEKLEQGKITKELWAALADPLEEFVTGTKVHVGVDVGVEGGAAHIAVAFERPDGKWHVEVVASRSGFRWVVDWLKARENDWFSGEVGIQSSGNAPAAALAPLLTAAGFTVAEWKGADWTGSVMAYYTAIQEGLVAHPGRDPLHPEEPTLLEVSATGVKDRKFGDVFVWDREKSNGDAAPFVATNIAWWLGNRIDQGFVSAYAGDDWDDEELGITTNSDSDDDFDGLMFV